MAENITTLTIEEMNNTVRKANPELYETVFKPGKLGALAGASILVFPLMGVQIGATLHKVYETTPLIIGGVIVGLIASAIVNLVFWTQEHDSKAAAPELLALAETVFPQATPGFGKTGLVFTPKTGEHPPC